MTTTLKIMDRSGHTTVESTDMTAFEEALAAVPSSTLFFDAKSKEQINRDAIREHEEVIAVPAFQGG